MKVCFYLQRNFAPVGDAIASVLRDEYGVVDFCAYVSTRPALDFLKKEAAVRYSSLMCDEDVVRSYKNEKLDIDYLRMLEKTYGIPNLWPYLMVDRTFMFSQGIREYPFSEPFKSHEDLLRILQVTAKSVIALLENEKPDAIVFSVVGALSSLLLYHIARAKGIPTHVIFPSLLENRFIVSSRHDHFSLKEELGAGFDVSPAAEALRTAREFLASFRASPQPYYKEFTPDAQQVSRAQHLRFLAPHRVGNSLNTVVREFQRYYLKEKEDDYSSIHPWHFLFDRVRRKLRNVRGIADFYDALPSSELFAFFPLQYEPEISLLVQAPFITSQIEAVRLAARSLPVGWKLYVKEHPQMVGYRPRAFYRALKKIPNVRVVDPSVKSFGLTASSGLVIVISSTAGFEACLLKKPVVTLGNHFYNDLSFVKHCERPSDMARLVQEQVNSFAYDEEELVHYIAKIIEGAALLNLGHIWYYERDANARREGVRPLAALIASRLRG